MRSASPPCSPASARTRSCGSSRPGRGCAPPASRSSTSGWASRARRRRRSSAPRSRTRSRRSRRTRARSACRSCAAAIAGWAARRFGVALDPDTEVIPTLGSKEAVFGLAQRLRRRRRGRADARLPGLRARRGVRGQAGRSSCRCARTNGWLPDLDGVDWTGVGDPVAQLPEQPDRARARRSSSTRQAAALAREHGFVLASDEAYSELYFAGEPPASALQVRRPLARRGLQHALQALVDARLPLRVRRRRPGDRRRAEEVPAERRRRAAGVRPARRGRGLGRRGRTSTRCASATAPSATRCCPRWRRSGCATRAATRRSSCGWTPARTPTRSPRAGSRRAWSSRPARSSARPGYLRLALVPPPEDCARAAELIRGLA